MKRKLKDVYHLTWPNISGGIWTLDVADSLPWEMKLRKGNNVHLCKDQALMEQGFDHGDVNDCGGLHIIWLWTTSISCNHWDFRKQSYFATLSILMLSNWKIPTSRRKVFRILINV